MYDTEFEEDLSDTEDYSGRRSEESVSKGRIYHTTDGPNRAISLGKEVIPLYPHLMRYERQA